MSEVRPAPARPGSPAASRVGGARWRDGRVVLGVLLVLVSVLVGARLLSSSDRTQRVWVATHELAQGTVLASGDLEPGTVRLFDRSGRYADAAATSPIGYLLTRPLGAGELLPVSAVSGQGATSAVRSVTVPTTTGHLPPDLRHGQVVDVYVTPGTTGAGRATPSPAHLVLARVLVDQVAVRGGLAASSSDLPVVLTVARDDVLTLVQAVAQGSIDLVRVPSGVPPPASPAP